jgi:hypothetical protein
MHLFVIAKKTAPSPHTLLVHQDGQPNSMKLYPPQRVLPSITRSTITFEFIENMEHRGMGKGGKRPPFHSSNHIPSPQHSHATPTCTVEQRLQFVPALGLNKWSMKHFTRTFWAQHMYQDKQACY